MGTSEFESWILAHSVRCDNGSFKTTLRQQVTLAKFLYDQVMGPQEVDVSPDEIISLYRNGEVDLEKIVQWKGVSVDWLLNVFCKSQYIERLADFGCELWFVRKVGIPELLRRHGLSSGAMIDHTSVFNSQLQLSGAAVKDATTFLSYTGRYKLEYFIGMLSKFKGEFLWIDIFCVDQFAWTGKSQAVEMEAVRDQLVAELQGNIETIGQTCLLLEKWNDAMATVDQIWVLWETFNTVESGAKFSIELGQTEIDSFLEAIGEGNQDFLDLKANLSKIDCEKAQAGNDADRTAILKVMKQHGLYNVSCRVAERVRDWVCSISRRHANSLLPLSQYAHENDVSPIVFIKNLSSLLSDQGSFEEAEKMLTEALTAFRRLLGSDSPYTLSSMHNLSGIKYDQGKLDEAWTLLEEALAGSRRVLGDKHRETLISINNMANRFKEQGNVTEAEALYREVIENGEELDSLTMMATNNVGLLLFDQGKYDEAEPFFESAISGFRGTLGDEHPDTLMAISNLAGVYHGQGRLEDSESRIRGVVSSYRRMLGNDHPDTLLSVNNLGELLQSRGEIDEAGELFREASSGFRQKLGDDHPFTLHTAANLEKCLATLSATP